MRRHEHIEEGSAKRRSSHRFKGKLRMGTEGRKNPNHQVRVTPSPRLTRVWGGGREQGSPNLLLSERNIWRLSSSNKPEKHSLTSNSCSLRVRLEGESIKGARCEFLIKQRASNPGVPTHFAWEKEPNLNGGRVWGKGETAPVSAEELPPIRKDEGLEIWKGKNRCTMVQTPRTPYKGVVQTGTEKEQ